MMCSVDGGRHHLLVSRKCHHHARLVETCRTVYRRSTDSTDSTVNLRTSPGGGRLPNTHAEKKLKLLLFSVMTNPCSCFFACFLGRSDGPMHAAFSRPPCAPSLHRWRQARTPLRDHRRPVAWTRPKVCAIDGLVTSSALHFPGGPDTWWSFALHVCAANNPTISSPSTRYNASSD